MTDQEIRTDRNIRADACKQEIESVLKKHEFFLTAEDNWTPNTKVKIEISFVDLKKYDSPVAQPDKPVAQTSKETVPVDTVVASTPIVPEGVQPDGSVVINADSLK